DIQNGTKFYRTAEKKHGIPASTLEFKLKQPGHKETLSPPPILTSEEEALLVRGSPRIMKKCVSFPFQAGERERSNHLQRKNLFYIINVRLHSAGNMRMPPSWDFITVDSIGGEQKFSHFMDILQEAYTYPLPKKTYVVRSDQGNNISWFNTDLSSMRERLRFLRELKGNIRLLEKLKLEGTVACGTIISNRKGLPKGMTNDKSLKRKSRQLKAQKFFTSVKLMNDIEFAAVGTCMGNRKENWQEANPKLDIVIREL
ncbi:unnamed protein product, partial [Acanthoscelides obtectus]